MNRRITFFVLIIVCFWLVTTGSAFAEASSPYFVWWGNPKEMTHANIAAPGPAQDIEFWENRGGLNAGHVGIGSSEIGYFDHDMGDEMRAKMEKLVDQGFKGITLEIERETDLEDAAVRNIP
ncbi:MAG: hypothetical protein KAX16_00145 [Actinomycetia bacterium]|nr:hypothetical protein [Actinomycetes bacterium]